MILLDKQGYNDNVDTIGFACGYRDATKSMALGSVLW